MRAAIIAAAIAGLAGPVRGDPLRDLGDAYRAYEAGDLAAARTSLARVDAARDATGLAVRDYLLWLDGMLWLRDA